MAKATCVRCGKELGFLSVKHKTSDGSIVCDACITKFNIEKYIEKIKSAGAWNIVLKIAEKHRNFLNEKSVLARRVLVGGEGYSEAIINMEMERAMRESPNAQEINVSYNGEPSHPIQEDFKNLVELLSSKYGLAVDKGLLLDTIVSAIAEVGENERPKKYERFKNIILSENPQTKEDYADAMLKHFGDDFDENLAFLTLILHENNINLDGSQALALLNERKKKLELDSFEKRLLGGESADKIDFNLMNGYEFERFLGELFKKMGYNVVNTKLSGDQGADLIIEKLGEKTAVQAKCYFDPVSNKAVQEVVASKNHYNCNKSLVITSSSFTKSAISLASSNNVELWDRKKLEEIIERYW